MTKQRILFLCTNNSARSQMAEGILRARHGNRFEVYSAGSQPTRVHPLAIRAMSEIGIDISSQHSKSVDTFFGQPMDYVVTLCDGRNTVCPVFPDSRNVMYKPFQDPAAHAGSDADKLTAFREVRDQLDDWIRQTFEKRSEDNTK